MKREYRISGSTFPIVFAGGLAIASLAACRSTEVAAPAQAKIPKAVDVSVSCGLDSKGKEFFGRWIAVEGGEGSLPAPGEETWSPSRSRNIDRNTALEDIVSVLQKRSSGETSKAILSWAETGADPTNIPPQMDACLGENGWTIAGRG